MEQINLTNTLAGLAAIQRCMAGEDILFTKLEIGDGILTNPDISGMTGLINKTKEYPLGAVQAEESEVIRVRSNISNKDVAEDLIIREYGIYAKFGEEQEFLFAYLNVGESTTPLPSQRIGRYELNRDFVLYIGNSLHVDFTSNGHLVYVAVNEYKDDMNRKGNVVGTIEDLKNSKKYKVGDVVQILGYCIPGDGGGHPRQKVAEGYAGKDAVIGADGSIWKIVHSGEISVSWLGARGDGIVDDTLAIQNALNLDSMVVLLEKGRYLTSLTLEIGRKHLKGLNMLESFIISNSDIDLINLIESKGIVTDIGLIYNTLNTKNVALRLSKYRHIQMCSFKNIYIENANIAIKNNDNYTCFSSTFDNIQIRKFNEKAIDLGSGIFGTTGNVFTNTYIDNLQEDGSRKHTKNVITLTGNTETSFRQLNLENLSADILIFSSGSKGAKITGLHLEKVNFSQSTISKNYIVNTTASDLVIENLTWGYSDVNTEKEVVLLKTTGICNIEINGINILNSVNFTRTNNTLVETTGSVADNTNIYIERYSNLSNSLFSNLDSNRFLKKFEDNYNCSIRPRVQREASFEETVSNLTTKEIFVPYISLSTATGYPRSSANIQHRNIAFIFGGIGDYVISSPSQQNLGKTYINTKITDTEWSGWRELNITQLQQFDTPYHASKMDKRGILIEYYAYLDELHEYEKAQNTDNEIMTLEIKQKPQLPKSIADYAKEYGVL